jgi:NAD(P)-dependent dehydrogenase (short-subunit alcohol dehydrogenase family)
VALPLASTYFPLRGHRTGSPGEPLERDERNDRFGRVDSLVNNAGVFVAQPFTEYTDGDYDLVTGVNLGESLHVDGGQSAGH